jgi:hypothetical protein
LLSPFAVASGDATLAVTMYCDSATRRRGGRGSIGTALYLAYHRDLLG